VLPECLFGGFLRSRCIRCGLTEEPSSNGRPRDFERDVVQLVMPHYVRLHSPGPRDVEVVERAAMHECRALRSSAPSAAA
jgi:hypothetical protein